MSSSHQTLVVQGMASISVLMVVVHFHALAQMVMFHVCFHYSSLLVATIGNANVLFVQRWVLSKPQFKMVVRQL
jgi:hypothetical protein